jgi:hypothetical protein
VIRVEKLRENTGFVVSEIEEDGPIAAPTTTEKPMRILDVESASYI